MGQIKGKQIKKAAKEIVEKYYIKLDNDFYHNRLVVEDVSEISSNRLRNKVAGYVTRLFKRTSTGAVKGLRIKKHEEERKKLESLIPKKSYLHEESVFVDKDTLEMLTKQGLNFPSIKPEDIIEVINE
ncbi:40S ribosomal protein S17 [Cucumispora dikerogammari]|nr:40S ribosomal protein S17 [Cucumispora dikerogammari]